MNNVLKILLLMLEPCTVWTMGPPANIHVPQRSPTHTYTQEIIHLINQQHVPRHDEETMHDIRLRMVRILSASLAPAPSIADFVQKYGQRELQCLIHSAYMQALDEHIQEKNSSLVESPK